MISPYACDILIYIVFYLIRSRGYLIHRGVLFMKFHSGAAAVLTAFLLASAGSAAAEASPYEVQVDSMHHAYFKNRSIDTISIHVMEPFKERGTVSFYRGITFTRPYGHITDHGVKRDSSALGAGPVFMVRMKRSVSGKWYGALDAGGGFIVYDKAFPAGGRAYNFMWRIGPRLVYQAGKNTSVSAGYLFMHVSNGFESRNPGYNGAGFSLGISSSW